MFYRLRMKFGDSVLGQITLQANGYAAMGVTKNCTVTGGALQVLCERWFYNPINYRDLSTIKS